MVHVTSFFHSISKIFSPDFQPIISNATTMSVSSRTLD